MNNCIYAAIVLIILAFFWGWVLCAVAAQSDHDLGVK